MWLFMSSTVSFVGVKIARGTKKFESPTCDSKFGYMLLTIESTPLLLFLIINSESIDTQASPLFGQCFPSPISRIQSAKCFIWAFDAESKLSDFRRMFCCNEWTSQNSQRYELLMQAWTVSCLSPFRITGKICLKSPPSTVVIPPNGFKEHSSLIVFIISRRDLSTASKQFLFAIGASSQIIKDVCIINSASCVPFFIAHVVSSVGFRGMLNLECAVRPPGNRRAAIPEVATAIAILPSDRTFAKSVLQRNVLPVPPEPYTKNNFPKPELIDWSTISWMVFCPEFRPNNSSEYSWCNFDLS